MSGGGAYVQQSVAWSPVFVTVCLQHFVKTIAAVVTKLSEYASVGSGIMPLNSPGGSTLQWDAGRGLLCLSPFVSHAVVWCLVVSKLS